MHRVLPKLPVLLPLLIPLAKLPDLIAHRTRDYHKLTFSMMYAYNEDYLLPFSHDEVVHGKATITQKMSGYYEDKFPHHRKRKLVVIPRSVLRGSPEIFQRIIHPAHIPFVIKPKSISIQRPGHIWIIR
mgnify:CR=1 FL=1